MHYSMYVDRTWIRNTHPQGPEKQQQQQQQQQNTALSCPVSTHLQTERVQRHTSPTQCHCTDHIYD